MAFVVGMYHDARPSECQIPLTHKVSFISYGNIMFDLRLPLRQEHNWTVKGGLLVSI
jgi:hypothetical protein